MFLLKFDIGDFKFWNLYILYLIFVLLIIIYLFIFQPILTSIRGTKIQQNPSNSTNLLLQAKQAGQNVQRRMTKPIVGKLVSNQRTQLPVDTVLANRKLPGVHQG